MMNRRSIMAMLGMAPAAAVMPPEVYVNPSPGFGRGINSSLFHEEDDIVADAKRRLEAAEWSAGKPQPVFDMTHYMDYDYGVESMKSWSRHMKSVVRTKRGREYHEKRRIEERRYNVARAMFIKMAPPQLRDFL
jgi:hypothetical protein